MSAVILRHWRTEDRDMTWTIRSCNEGGVWIAVDEYYYFSTVTGRYIVSVRKGFIIFKI